MITINIGIFSGNAVSVFGIMPRAAIMVVTFGVTELYVNKVYEHGFL